MEGVVSLVIDRESDPMKVVLETNITKYFDESHSEQGHASIILDLCGYARASAIIKDHAVSFTKTFVEEPRWKRRKIEPYVPPEPVVPEVCRPKASVNSSLSPEMSRPRCPMTQKKPESFFKSNASGKR
ncbi:hypothetical protein L596_006142 [Steinernema carpocapsae]|uniref:Uncharacterized protein n=1 Tax=Steinernema carpocapsae TaxID=34508 RepID=A0A4U8V1A6_STECR|nr:hypothetical protein L596_006142 [Steinernema carpocapsae]